MRKSSLGEFEQILLLAILRLGHRAFGTPIAEELERFVEETLGRLLKTNHEDLNC